MLFVLLILSAGCREQQSEGLQEIFFDEEAEYSDRTPKYEFIPLETGSGNLLSEMIDHAEIVNGRIFVSDKYSKSLHVYDRQGKFMTRVGSVGQGPGEYITPGYFRVDKNAGIIWVNGCATNLLAYDLDTYRYLFTKRVQFMSWIFLADGNYALWRPLGYMKDDKKYTILITDTALRHKNYFHVWEYDIPSGVSFTTERFYGCKDKAFFYDEHDPIVYEITSDGEKAAYKLTFGRHSFPSLDELKELTDGRKLMNTDYLVCYVILDTEQFILSKYMVKRNMHFGVYDKKKKKAYRYTDFHGDNALLRAASLVGTTDDGRFILSLPAAEFLKHRQTQRADVRAVLESISEEDNPVLCLVTFK